MRHAHRGATHETVDAQREAAILAQRIAIWRRISAQLPGHRRLRIAGDAQQCGRAPAPKGRRASAPSPDWRAVPPSTASIRARVAGSCCKSRRTGPSHPPPSAHRMVGFGDVVEQFVQPGDQLVGQRLVQTVQRSTAPGAFAHHLADQRVVRLQQARGPARARIEQRPVPPLRHHRGEQMAQDRRQSISRMRVATPLHHAAELGGSIAYQPCATMREAPRRKRPPAPWADRSASGRRRRRHRPGASAATTTRGTRKLDRRKWASWSPIRSLLRRHDRVLVCGIGRPSGWREQRGHREPVRQPADHRRLGKGAGRAPGRVCADHQPVTRNSPAIAHQQRGRDQSQSARARPALGRGTCVRVFTSVTIPETRVGSRLFGQRPRLFGGCGPS